MKGNEATKKWLIDKATNIVRGRILSLRAGNEVTKVGHRLVVAKMKVNSAVKGDVGPGEITLVTGFGTGDCGIPSFLLTAIAWDRDTTIEIVKNEEAPSEYFVSVCGYGVVEPMPGLNLKKKDQ